MFLDSDPPEFCGLAFWALDCEERLSDALDDSVVCAEGFSDALDDWEVLVEDIASTTSSGSYEVW